MTDSLVIIGGSYAGLQIAASARELGFAGCIRLVTGEGDAPYHRPPLSKGLLTGKADEATLPLRSPAFYADNAIELVTDSRATAIDRAARRIETTSAGALDYTHLALATGARPRALPVPGAGLDGVVMLRSLADARILRTRLDEARSVAVIGGGFIGLEVASAAAAMGKQVAVFEAQGRLLARAATPVLAEYVRDLHLAKGVALHLNAAVMALEGEGRVAAVVLADGARHPADLVVVGIGVLPNVELAEAAGLACQDGIVVDRFARTSDPAIVAAGDCTRAPSLYADHLVRLESVQNAMDQAKSAAASLVGLEKPYEAPPWFWSDQYDVKFQMVGLVRPDDRVVLRGNPADGKFSIFYFRGDALSGIDSINRPADHMLGRKLIAQRFPLTADQAADTGLDLAAMLKAAA